MVLIAQALNGPQDSEVQMILMAMFFGLLTLMGMSCAMTIGKKIANNAWVEATRTGGSGYFEYDGKLYWVSEEPPDENDLYVSDHGGSDENVSDHD